MEKGLVSIDRWGKGSQAYFLTHLHADHMKGLSSKWSRGNLFCSPISAMLLPSKFPGFDLSLIRVLEVGVTQIVSLRSPATGSEVRLLLTPIDAHHCPGAVMYLFRGKFGRVLYTGDFRWELKSERAHMARKTLKDALEGHEVDVLYLDNTYCHPSFSFPPREVAAQQVLDIINLHPDHEVVIAIDTLGKEDLLLHISQALGMKIWVWPERLKTMHLLGFDENFTTNTSLTRVRAVPRYSFTYETLAALNTLHPTIGIMPSGVPWVAKSFEKNGCVSLNGNIQLDTGQMVPRKFHQYAYSVQYSEHSCFSEIQGFIKFLLPSTVTGIVSSSTCYINPQYYFSHICGSNQFWDSLCKTFRNERGKNFEAERSDDFIVCKRCSKRKMKKAAYTKPKCSIRRKGRVHIMRRGRMGVTIAKDEDICSSVVKT